MIRIRNLSLRPGEGQETLYELAEKALGCPVKELKIVKKSIDARKKKDVRILYAVDAAVADETGVLVRKGGRDIGPTPAARHELPTPGHMPALRPVVVGFGPAGMFAALVLAKAGLCPIVLERGEDGDARARKVLRLRREGKLDPESNIQFGEGGAGAFSDGKLSTGVKDRRIPWVLEALVEAGAPVDITTGSKPHIGTDLLPAVCANIRRQIIALGGEVRFGEKLIGLERSSGGLSAAITESGRLPCDRLILACGHSARDTFEFLCKLDIPMQPKAFAMGLRIEHLQSDTDKAQYGAFAGHPDLPPADYSLAVELPNGRRCYSFCMCPGGEVVPAASEEGLLCTNGASPNKRNYVNSNAALLAAVSPEDFPYEGILGGMAWQRELERRAFELGGGGYIAPAQTVGGFLTGKDRNFGKVTPSYAPGVRCTDLHRVLPPVIAQTIAGALPLFAGKLKSFADPAAVLTGPETRSSSPVRMQRDGSLQSPALRGLYPCGEGAGWAGGIISAAVDGMKCAEALIMEL